MNLKPKSNAFEINAIQSIIITRAPQGWTSKELARLLSGFSDQFDAPPTILPLPTEAPAELPRVILRSSDLHWIAEMAASRVTFRWIKMKETSQLGIPEFEARYLSFFDTFLAIQPIQVSRLAFAINRHSVVQDPAELLMGMLHQEELLRKIQNPENFELHIHLIKKLAETFTVNEWTRFKSGQLTIPDTPVRRAALIEHDVNTVDEPASDVTFSMVDIKRFMSAAAVEIEKTFRSLCED
jgi:hypothetical protein